MEEGKQAGGLGVDSQVAGGGSWWSCLLNTGMSYVCISSPLEVVLVFVGGGELFTGKLPVCFVSVPWKGLTCHLVLPFLFTPFLYSCVFISL